MININASRNINNKGVYNQNGIINGDVNVVIDDYYNNGSIDWEEINKELNILQSAKSSLSSDMQAITDELTEAAKEKNESAFKTICKKIGQSALPLIESLGLNFISCFIKGII